METKYSAPAVVKMLAMIEILSKNTGGFSINELARLTGASVNSVYRICMEMEKKNYLVKDPKTGYYCLGSAFYFIGKAAEKRMDLRNNAVQIMQRLKEITGETVHLTVLRGDKMILLEQVETDNYIKIHVNIGASLYPHGSAFGKCLLVYAGEEYLSEYAKNSLIPLTASTITDARILAEEFKTIQSEGVAYDNEEYMEGVMCCGSPVFGLEGKCVAALGVIFPKYRADKKIIQEFAVCVKEAAKELSNRMGDLRYDGKSF